MTTRSALATAARTNGWTVAEMPSEDEFSRDTTRIVVIYTANGAAQGAIQLDKVAPGSRADVGGGWAIRSEIGRTDAGKRETVLAWLRLDPRIKVTRVTAANGTPFTIAYTPQGVRHPVFPAQETDKGSLVDFYDARYPEFSEFGQFTGGRYYVDTILGRDGYGSGTGALDLYGGEDAWSLDAESMATVRAWLEGFEPAEVDEDGNPRDYAREHAERLGRWLGDKD